ncbi:vgr related protein [Pontixanthobacter sp. CEM42]|uniref:vgr related protein n=1 Tax=Pontixanthobacter sp. CEM42 TaxID=2792077 RepID=UPI001AE0C7BE|nr:vgr related protein [Pontixanthobacter sp. CEM42]
MPGEVELARSVFGTAIDYSTVKIRRKKWMPFQPRKVVMAPRGHIHFHPSGNGYCDDFSTESLTRQGLFIHEMVHVWQSQVKGSWWLVFHRMPWAAYDYSLRPGWALEDYGIEQQAEIVKHAFWLRNGLRVRGIGDAAAYDSLVNFPGAA